MCEIFSRKDIPSLTQRKGKSDALRRDIRSNNAYWKRYETPVSEVSDRVNDAYLKANGQENGLRSYGRMVDLLLAYYRDELQ